MIQARIQRWTDYSEEYADILPAQKQKQIVTNTSLTQMIQRLTV